MRQSVSVAQVSPYRREQTVAAWRAPATPRKLAVGLIDLVSMRILQPILDLRDGPPWDVTQTMFKRGHWPI